MTPFIVNAFWDAEAGVWSADSDDIPGLATEADTVDALLVKLTVMIPELVEANWPGANEEDITFQLRTWRDAVAPRLTS